MKICGTVRRPLRAIISARASGRSSMLIVSKRAPLRSSRLTARLQNGHQLVRYTTILGGSVMKKTPTAASCLGERQVLGTPGGDAASQVECLREALGYELPHGGGTERAGVIVHN